MSEPLFLWITPLTHLLILLQYKILKELRQSLDSRAMENETMIEKLRLEAKKKDEKVWLFIVASKLVSNLRSYNDFYRSKTFILNYQCLLKSWMKLKREMSSSTTSVLRIIKELAKVKARKYEKIIVSPHSLIDQCLLRSSLNKKV